MGWFAFPKRGAGMDARALNRTWSLLTAAERRESFVLLGWIVVGMVMETLGVGLMLPAIALLTQRGNSTFYPLLEPVVLGFGGLSQGSLAIWGMLILVAVYLVKTLFLGFLASRQMRFVFGLETALAQRLFSAYIRQPYLFHLQRNSAQLIRDVVNDVSVFANFGVQAGMTLVSEYLVLAALGVLLLTVEPVGTMILASVLVLFAWGFGHVTRGHVARAGAARRHHDGLRLQHLQQGLGGAKDVKLLGREAEFLARFNTHTIEGARAARLLATIQQLPRLVLELLAVSALAIVVITMVVQGRSPDAVLPTLGVFAAAAMRLMPSMNRLLAARQSMRYGLSVIESLRDGLNLLPPDAPTSGGAGKAFHRAVELDHITFTYPDAEAPALCDVSFVIRRGECVGLIGDSGAGKSTLVDVLLGLLPPDRGQVLVDGTDIQAVLRNWQDQIGYVPQAIFLTDDSLLRNVAFGLSNEQIDEAAVWRAVNAARLAGFVAGLPQGLDTVVGERGVRLSGGQRQRIGIARALYHDPAVLVLDEATNSLDVAMEEEVMRAVRALHGSKTIVIVAHRPSTIEHCDRVYQLAHGRLEQSR